MCGTAVAVNFLVTLLDNADSNTPSELVMILRI
jgi:hypothetical protein